ncbi:MULTISPECIES: chemotaxis protein CheW [Salinibaculum]|uniref:chemotaxis protein CheW n=1 Tax=Salinibaculum TaxID=2732368 RepID=UPI0030CFF400
MSENERMERAKRIRRMREGQRDEDGDDAVEESNDQEPGAPTNGAGSDADAEEAIAATEPTSADGGTAAAEPTTTEPAPDESDGDDGDDVSAPLDTGGDTRADLPSADEMEAAMEQTMAQAETVDDADGDEPAAEPDDDAPAGPAGIAGETAETTQEPETRVLEFTLDDEQYCLDIEYIEEIVKHTAITRVPNTPDFVEGVVDLRGQITTILNPKVTIDKPDKTAGDLVVVFDAEAFEDQGHIGWVVDDVSQVSPVSDDEVNDPPMSDDYINGVIDREEDDEFVIWTTPDLALDEAE